MKNFTKRCPESPNLFANKMRFVGHSFRSKEELAGDVLLWQPKHGKQSTGRPKKSV